MLKSIFMHAGYVYSAPSTETADTLRGDISPFFKHNQKQSNSYDKRLPQLNRSFLNSATLDVL